MDRRSLIKKTGIAGVLATGIAPAVHAQPALRWRLASSFPRGLDIIFGTAEVFARKVQQLSGGRFTVSVHPSGELMPAYDVLDGVRQGSVELAHTAPHYFSGKDETFAIDSGIPFGLNSRQANTWYFDGNGLKLMREFYAKYNIVSFPCGNTGAQMGTWCRKEITSLEDLKGAKLRVGGLAGRVLERLGGVPVAVAGAALVRSLQDGSVDVAEWIGPYDDQRLGLNLAAPYCSYPGWREGGAQLALYANMKAHSALNDEQKAIVEAASAFAHLDMQARYDSKNPTALKQMVGRGTQMRAFPADLVAAAFKQSMELYEEFSAKNENWKAVYADYRKLRADQNLWFFFSERTFDSFMQRQEL